MARAAASVEYGGRTYFFCSTGCGRRFLADPQDHDSSETAEEPPAPRPARRSRAANWLLAGVGGVVTAVGFADGPWWFAAPVGVGVLVLAMRGDSARSGAMGGFVWGLALFLPHIWWANYAVGVLPWLGLSALEAAIIALGCGAWVWVRRSPLVHRHAAVRPLAFAAVWVVTEQLRQVWPFGGFPWGRLAFSQADGPLLALASIGGAPLVSIAVAAAGYLLAMAYRAVREGRPAQAAVTAALVAVIPVAGALVPLPVDAQTGILRVGAVQGDVSTPGLDAFSQAREVLDNHVAGTVSLLDEVDVAELDLILWPENATDINPRTDDAAAVSIDQVARRLGAPILLGADRYVGDDRFNDMVLWRPGQGAVFAYSKQIPAAFGEYIPWRGFFRLFSPEIDRVRVDMARGSAPGRPPRCGTPGPDRGPRHGVLL